MTPADRLIWAQKYLDILDQRLAAVEADVLELDAQRDELDKVNTLNPTFESWTAYDLAVGRALAARLVHLPTMRRNHWAAVDRRDRAALNAEHEPVPA